MKNKPGNKLTRKILLLLTLLFPWMSAGLAGAAGISGRVEYAHIYHLNVGVSGEVKSVSVEEGNRVTKGTVLLQLDTTLLEARKAAAQAKKAYFEAMKQEAERALERDQELFADGSLSTVELDLRKIETQKANVDYLQSEAELIQSLSHINLSRVVAPVAGIVLQRNANPGERIIVDSAPAPAFVFASENKVIRANFDTESAEVPQQGGAASINYGEAELEGKVAAVDPLAGPGQISITIHSSQPLPPAGETVEISFGE
jgi:multidrug resistance efflux pump